MREVVIVAAARTPIGSFGGSLMPMTAVNLGVIAAKAVFERAGVSPDIVEETIIGNVISAGQGQNVARQVSIGAGVPETVPAMTLDCVCGSSLRTVSLAAQLIGAGEADVILAGGTESMTNAPYMLKTVRWGQRMGNEKLLDSLVADGLWDVFNDYHMGMTAEDLAVKGNISREEQDAFALESQRRVAEATSAGKFKAEITPVEVPQRKGGAIILKTDEYPKPEITLASLSKLKPVFKPDGGTVTAGNSSGVNDGAAMVLVMSKEKAEELGIQYMAKIIGFASGGVDPSIMGYGVVPATRKALERAGISIDQLDLIESNEAFAAQSIYVMRELEFSPEKTNVNGGAISLGHPIGASGARVLTTLLYELERRDGKYGLATLCVGGGMGVAVVVER